MREQREEIRDLLGLKNIDEKELRTEIERPIWDHTFLRMAIDVADRSHDAQTKNGCVLVRDNTVLSTGYNGFIRNIDDTVLPNLRPQKYPFMIHAEHNAVLNCARNGISTLGATCYITSNPCVFCLQYLWQAGITYIVYTDWSKNVMCDNEMLNMHKALMMLINPTTVTYDNFALPEPTYVKHMNLSMKFIPKNDVLPNKNVDKTDR